MTTTTSSSDAASSSPHFLVTIPQRTDRSKLLVGDDTASSSTLASVSKTLRFKNPRDTEDGGYLCTAALIPGSKRLHVCATNASIKSITDGVSKTRKITVNVSKDQARQFMALDAVVLDYVKLHVEQWFDGKMDDALVEEYYRPTIVADSGNGVCAKMHVVSKGLPKDLREGDHSLRLQLLGIQFRRQHFTLVWKYVDRTVPLPEDEASDSEPVKRAAEHEDDDEEEEEEDDVKSALMYSGERESKKKSSAEQKKTQRHSNNRDVEAKEEPVKQQKSKQKHDDRKNDNSRPIQQQSTSTTMRSRDERGAEAAVVPTRGADVEERMQEGGGGDTKTSENVEYDFVSEKDDAECSKECVEDDEEIPAPSWDEYEQMRSRVLEDIDSRVVRFQDYLEKLKTCALPISFQDSIRRDTRHDIPGRRDRIDGHS